MLSAAEGFSKLLAAFDRLELAYLVGGSVASSIHGISRPTMDVDISLDLQSEQVDDLIAALGPQFYADREMILGALKRRRPFNLIHMPSTFKIDIFPLQPDDYSQVAFSRRRIENSRSFGTEPIECSVATAEDTILRKLEWYRAGGEASTRQWNDLRGILKVSGKSLDRDYLRRWAGILLVDDLLQRLLGEQV